MAYKLYTDPRDAVFNELYDIAVKDKNVIVISCDTGAMKFKDFQENIPKQYINVGIAEQNAMSVAAGLSSVGKKVFVFGISNFVSLRCLEQIKIDICSMNRNVAIIGMGTGYSYSSDGPTHHITEDVAVLSSIMPNIWSPSDCTSTVAGIHDCYKNNGPSYLRFDKELFKQLYSVDNDFSKTFSEVIKGKKTCLVSTSITTSYLYNFAKENNLGLVDIYKIKPLNFSVYEVLSEYERVITVEEHSVYGGIGDRIANILLSTNAKCNFLKMGIKNPYRTDVGDREYMRTLEELDIKSISRYI